MESRGPNQSLQERLVDERALAIAEVPGYVLQAQASSPIRGLGRYDALPAPRYVGAVRPALSIHDVLADTLAGGDEFAGYIGTSRPSMGMY